MRLLVNLNFRRRTLFFIANNRYLCVKISLFIIFITGIFDMKRRILIISLSIVAIASIAAALLIAPFFLNKNEKDTIIYIYPDMTEVALEDSIKARLGEDFGKKTSFMLKVLDAKAYNRTGAYLIPNGLSPYKAARKLQYGGQTGVKFIFNNVRFVDNFAERVGKRLLMEKDDLLTLLKDSAFCAKYGKTPQTISTIFQPDSYEFYWTVKPEDFVDRMYHFYNKFWNEERLAKAKALGLTPDEVATLASIVEDETAKRDERGKVARLYLNRIKIRMKLQADPTVRYAIGNYSIRRVYSDMLKTDSPYNTYLHFGLPPGPIRYVEKSTLDAVLNAPSHNYIYMCAKEDFSGYHNFATSYSEHKANARRYQKELNRRGIKR